MKRLWMIPVLFVAALALVGGLVRDSGASVFQPAYVTVIAGPAPVVVTNGGLAIQNGGVNTFSFQNCSTGLGATTCIYGKETTPGSSNWFFQGASGQNFINGTSEVAIGINNNFRVIDVLGGQIGFTQPLGGYTGTAFSWATTASAIACTTGGTQTVSSAQSITPGLNVTWTTLTSNCVIDFSTNAVTGYYLISLSGTSLSTYTLGFKNGTTTRTMLAAAYTALTATGATGVHVWTHGTNTIDVL